MVRARQLLTSLAVVGIGGAIYSVLRGSARRARGGRVDSYRADGVPDPIEVQVTSPYAAILVEEVLAIEAELPPDGSILDLSIFDPSAEPMGTISVDARPDDPERVVAEMFEAADDRAEGTHQGGDDREDGENWVDDLLVDSAMDMPAERPLFVDPDDAAAHRR